MTLRDALARLLARLRRWLGSGEPATGDPRGNGDRAGGSDDRVVVYASDGRAEAAREREAAAERARERSGTDGDDRR